MDFIKNLHISDIVEDKNHSADDTTPAPPPPTAIGASHPHPHSSSSPPEVDNSKHGSSILDKIEEALSNHVEHNDKDKDKAAAPHAVASTPAAAVVHDTHNEKEKEDLFSKIGDVLSGGGGNKTPPVPVHAPAHDTTHPHGEQTDGTLFRKLAELMGGSTSVVEAAPTPATQAHDNNKEENLLSKLGDAISVRKTPPPPPPPAPVAHRDDNILHKLGDAISGRKTPPPPVPAPVVHKEENILHKLGDAISGKKTPPPVPVPVAHKDENILHKLEDAISGKKTPPPPPPDPVKDENILHKLGDVLAGGGKTNPPPVAAAVPVPEKHHNINVNIVDKLTEAVTGKTEQHQHQHVVAKPESFVHQLSEVVLKKDEEDKKRVERPHGLADRLNSALGGGSKGELEEGRLDKAIDMFQEHVLKQGPQNNESPVEQAKDKEIANMIRTAVGKEAK